MLFLLFFSRFVFVLQTSAENIFGLIHAALGSLLLVLLIFDLCTYCPTALMLFLMLFQAQSFSHTVVVVVDSTLRILLVCFFGMI